MRKAALFSLGLSLFLLGCLHAPDPQVTAPMPGQPMAYTLKPGDILDIEITGDADMSRQYPIDVDGTIALPLIGSIPAAGSSVAVFQEELRKRLLAGYFRNPAVSASLVGHIPLAPAQAQAQWTAPPLRQSEVSADNVAASAATPALRVTSEQ
jgi:Polysaccharide biosynthesis/export protein